MNIKEKINLDYLFKQLHKRQRFLMFRFIFLVLIVLFSYKPILGQPDTEMHLVLNATILFIAPLFLDYLLGMEAHNLITNLSRIVGFVFSISILSICIYGLMGGTTIMYDESGYMTDILIHSINIDIISAVNIICVAIPAIAFVDFIFTLNSSELNYYKIQDQLNIHIKEQLAKIKKEQTFDNQVEKVKTSLRNLVEETKGGKP